jgi:CubicO group peptidase (beta-lactamase class C family)
MRGPVDKNDLFKGTRSIRMNRMNYFPEKDARWERIDPEKAGFEPKRLDEAVDFAVSAEADRITDVKKALLLKMAEPPPYDEIIGPVKPHAGTNGLILKNGRIVAEWGDTRRVDMTFSASKSYISICAGLAYDRGLIQDFHEPVCSRVDDGGFDPPHNHKITWQHLLQQTSEWEGSLWGKPDWIDRDRDVSISEPQTQKGTQRPLQAPGTYFEYNDVRVNRTALALLRMFKRPLPEVLKESIMDPIGASDTWQWHGYNNSFVDIDGRSLQSVSGGGHWGGGLFINSRDHARVGYLLLRGGVWDKNRLLSEDFLSRATTPCDQNPGYGYMFWLNTGKTLSPGIPETSYFARGAGANIVWIEPENDLVVVFRWVVKEKFTELCEKVFAALR